MSGTVTVIRRLAIVNRGEPAVRALTAVAELNHEGVRPPITTIVLYTEPDAKAWFVREADEAISLGESTELDPQTGRRRSRYLDEALVVDLLHDAGVDAVWPGWGFLSERASFAERCEKAGIVFVGPDSAAMHLLGDKVRAKRLAESAGVPVIAWGGEPADDAATAADQADRIGYPVVVKASASGGGRGIRVVRGPADLAAAFTAARDEALLAAGDPTVFVERLMPAARHVEVQVIADHFGTTWAVGVRDCSVQRRHQKVLEESGSPALETEAEEALKQAAVRLMSAAGYRNAGTVEFLVDPATGDFRFLEVNTRLQVEHPVTEETTGLDLVKLQLHVAAGGRLLGSPPVVRGYAVEARLCAEDPEQGFAPAPGRLIRLALPSGPGIRVDTGVAEGDTPSADFDSMIAKIVACGRDRAEALSRLRYALTQTTVVVEGGTTNRSFLVALLDRDEVRRGLADNAWLDGFTAAGGHVPAPDPVALLVSAVEAYTVDADADRLAFHAQAARGRPSLPAETGHRCTLRYRNVRYPIWIFRVGPDAYRVDIDGTLADVTVERLDQYRRRVIVGGRPHRAVAVADGAGFRLDIDGVGHTVVRDDGGVVRCGSPAFVVAVRVAPGDVVGPGEPLAVLESMKMETTVTAPYGGVVSTVEITANTQVDAGAELLRLRPLAGDVGAKAPEGELDLRGLTLPETPGGPLCERVYAALHSYLLGYDLDPAARRGLFTRQRRLGEIAAPSDEGLARCEDGLLDLFADVGSLYRPRSEPVELQEAGAPPEYLLSYLQWLDADRAGIPEGYRQRLEVALRRYGVPSLERTPALEDAVVWMFRSFSRVGELVPVVTAILQRRLRHRAHLPPAESGGRGVDGDPAQLRTRLSRLAAAAQGRHQVVADLARDLLFRLLDEPILAGVVRAEFEAVGERLARLRAAPDGERRAEDVRRLVDSPQPLRATLLRYWIGHEEPGFREVLLEVHTRRYYRIRDLGPLAFPVHSGYQLCTADYDLPGKPVHLITAYAPLDELPVLSMAVAEHLAQLGDAGRKVVVDLLTWRCGGSQDSEALAGEVAQIVASCRFGTPLWRLDVTVTVTDGSRSQEQLHTRHFTYRPNLDGGHAEDRVYRNLHPMLAKRLELWRLANFHLERLESDEDVYLFQGVARDNPADHRLFAMAEVRDLTPVPDGAGAVTYPRLQLMGSLALAAMRNALSAYADNERPALNRIVLYVRPPWTVPKRDWARMARSFASLAVGAGLHKVVMNVRLPSGSGLRDAVLHIEGLGRRGVTVRERPPGTKPILPLTAYAQKVLRAQRFGAPYAYEIVRALTQPEGVVGRFPTGRFTEYDLDGAGRLRPAERPPGENTANIVVGLLTNVTAKVPEGMTRVALLGDATRGLGNLTEAECRRIIAGIDLAEWLGVPVEWFALSSGARIAMDSGTENMDWIAAVLRRIIEFTQRAGEINVVVAGVNVGAQPYWNAEATMLMHTKGVLIMTPASAMVLTGKQALDFSGGVSADDNLGIGGFDRIMGPNGQGQYWAPTLEDACDLLLRHYEHTYVVPGERYPRRTPTTDPVDRDICVSPHPADGLERVGDIFSAEHNPDRKRPFDIRSVLRSVTDQDSQPLERWTHWRGAESVVVWDAHIGGIAVCLLGWQSRTVPRQGFVPADGPTAWTSGTLFPQSSRKVARAVNAASGNRPLVLLANLSGFDGSPESMRHWQLEYGAEIGRAITNFQGPVVFVVVSRYHGGAFVVFSKRLNERMEIAAVEGSFASVIGGAPAAATVFARDVKARTEADPRVRELTDRLRSAPADGTARLTALLATTKAAVRAEKLSAVAGEFDAVHSIERALAVGSVDRIIAPCQVRPYVIDALERGMAADTVK